MRVGIDLETVAAIRPEFDYHTLFYVLFSQSCGPKQKLGTQINYASSQIARDACFEEVECSCALAVFQIRGYYFTRLAQIGFLKLPWYNWCN